MNYKSDEIRDINFQKAVAFLSTVGRPEISLGLVTRLWPGRPMILVRLPPGAEVSRFWAAFRPALGSTRSYIQIV